MKDFPRYDDVGSFPLPDYIDKEKFRQYYWIAYKGLVNNNDIFENRGVYNFFVHPVLQSFQLKLNSGVEIINYPQLMDMYNQFLKPIVDYELEPGLIDPANAYISEMVVLDKFAREYHERTGNVLNVKICITGPVELFIKQHGFTIYLDMAMNYARSVNSFLKKAIINTKYMKTSVVSIDEPSFGFVDVMNVKNEEIIQILDKSLDTVKASRQIHLHTLNQAILPLNSKNIDVLTCEYASDNTNIIQKKELDQHDKFMRVGISRTNINSLLAEALDSGLSYENIKTFEGTMNLIDSKERIKKNLLDALKLYGDRLKFVGPDCGLSGWYPPQVAYELLHRTYEVIEDVKISYK